MAQLRLQVMLRSLFFAQLLVEHALLARELVDAVLETLGYLRNALDFRHMRADQDFGRIQVVLKAVKVVHHQRGRGVVYLPNGLYLVQHGLRHLDQLLGLLRPVPHRPGGAGRPLEALRARGAFRTDRPLLARYARRSPYAPASFPGWTARASWTRWAWIPLRTRRAGTKAAMPIVGVKVEMLVVSRARASARGWAALPLRRNVRAWPAGYAQPGQAGVAPDPSCGASCSRVVLPRTALGTPVRAVPPRRRRG